jgi:TonB-dependent receptor
MGTLNQKTADQYTVQPQRIRRMRFQLTRLVLCMSATSMAYAEQPAVEYVQVIGQAASMDKALKAQQRADQISSVVHADDIAQLPDDNAAEALQRIPGVSTERDQGEGRFVSVRGLGADLNSVTINGTLVPAPESDRRGVALDVLPSELIQSLSVVKSLTPDMDANSLGGTIQVESLSAFDHKDLFYTATLEGSYDDNREKYSPKVSGALSQKFSVGDGKDNFGVAAALSWQDRKFGSDNVETGGAWDDKALEETSMRKYEIARERLGAGLNFDFKPNSTGHYYLRTLFSRFKDTETRNAAGVEFEEPLKQGELGNAEGFREIKSRVETQEVKSFVLGGKQGFGLWTLDSQLGYSEASEKNPGGIAGAVFKGDFENVGFESNRRPVVIAGSDFYKGSNFELDEVEWEQSQAKDKEKNAKFDLSRDYTMADYAAQFKLGAKVSQREKTNDTNIWVYDEFDNDFNGFNAGSVDYQLGKFGPAINGGTVLGQLKGLDRTDFFDDEESAINDFKINEDIQSAYVMNTVDIDKLRIIGGLRYEKTKFKAQGHELNDGDISRTVKKNDYDNWLPSLHLRYQISDTSLLRAAWTNSVVRPNFAQSSPGVYINTEDMEAEFGNPQLKPLEASNFDVGVEHYLGHASVISLFAFYKNIDNFIYNTDLAGTGDWTEYEQALSFKNGNKAKIYGFEAAYSQKFDSLPAPWNGLLMGANATFSHSDAQIDSMLDGKLQQRDIKLPSHSKIVGNALLGWENERFGLRVSANYKSPYLFEVAGIDEPQKDLHADKQVFVDVSSRWSISKNVHINFDISNLSNEKYYIYSGQRDLNAQHEQYGTAYKLGLTLTHF